MQLIAAPTLFLNIIQSFTHYRVLRRATTVHRAPAPLVLGPLLVEGDGDLVDGILAIDRLGGVLGVGGIGSIGSGVRLLLVPLGFLIGVRVERRLFDFLKRDLVGQAALS